ncbi:MAG: hypothetical protein K8S00_09660, partial [Bacteroidales bacterium]|nr:hypothetical protein [Bacteroidales bacterium]
MTSYIKYILFIILLNVVFVGFISAQNEFKSEDDVAKEAKGLFDKEEYVKALPLYSQLLSLHPKDPFYNYSFGVCLLFGDKRDTEKPIRYLEFAAKNLEGHPEVHYYLAMVYHMNYRFSEAIKEYKTFVDTAKPAMLRKLNAVHKIEMCENGISLLKTINDLYILEKTEVLKKNFYRSYNIKDFSGQFLFKPYEIKSRLDKRKDDHSIVFFSDTNRVIYFSSYGNDRKGSKDIYRSVKQGDGVWSDAEKLDSVINTAYDEDYPYLLPDGKTLYFCSKGHNSMGGYDIFKSVFDTASGGMWSKPENLDFAINTPFDDILFVSDSSQKYACFSSARSSVDDYVTVYKVRIDNRPVIKENLALDILIAEGEPEKNEDYQATLTYIKDKARLDVNATDEIVDNIMMAEAINVEESPVKEVVLESGLEDKMDARIREIKLNEQKVDTAFAMVKVSRNALKNIKQQKLAAFYVANQKHSLAGIKYRQSNQVFAEAEKLPDGQGKKYKNDYADELRNESRDLDSESTIAYNIGKQLEKQQIYKEKELERILSYAGDIQKLVAVEDTDSSSALLESLLAEARFADTLIDYSTPEAYIKGIHTPGIAEALNYFEKAKSLKNEANELENEALEYLKDGDNEADENRKADILAEARQLADEAEKKRIESVTTTEKGLSIAYEAGDINKEAAYVYNVINEVNDLKEVDEQQLALNTESPDISATLPVESKAAQIDRRLEQYQEEDKQTADDTVIQQHDPAIAANINTKLDKLVNRVEDEENYLRESSKALLVFSNRQNNLSIKKMAESDSILTLMSSIDNNAENTKQNLEKVKALREEALKHKREAVASFGLSEYFHAKTEEKRYETALQKSRAEDIHALVDDGKIEEAGQELEKFEAETNEVISDTSYLADLSKEKRQSIHDNRVLHESVLSDANQLLESVASLEQKAIVLRNKAETKKSLVKKQSLISQAEEYEDESRETQKKVSVNFNMAEKIKGEIAMLEMQNVISEDILPQLEISGYEGVDSKDVISVNTEELSQFINDHQENNVFADSNIYTSETIAIIDQYEVIEPDQTEIVPVPDTETPLLIATKESSEDAKKELAKAQLIARSVDFINSEIIILRRNSQNINDPQQKTEMNEKIERMQYLSDSLSIQAYELYKTAELLLQREGIDAESLSGQFDEQSLALSFQEEAYENFSEVSTLRNEALSISDQEEQKQILSRADDLEDIAMYKQLEVFEVFGIGNRNNFYANKIILEQIRIDNEIDDKLRIARELEAEAQYYYEQALYFRYKSKQENLPYDQKLVFLQEANSLELMALDKQKEAIELYRDVDRRAPSDEEILAERVVTLNVLDFEEQEIAVIRDRMAGIEPITLAELSQKEIIQDLVTEPVEAEEVAAAVAGKKEEEVAVAVAVAVAGDGKMEEEVAVAGEDAVIEEGEPNIDLVDVIVDRPEAFVVNYNDEYPIPVNPDVPVGLIFKVQIAAFRNPIPQNTFDGLSPISAEKVPTSNFTRYMTGLFYDLEEAVTSRDRLRQIGYSDAFVVAYLNGERISLTQARNMIQSGEAVTTTAIGSGIQISEKLFTATATAPATAPATIPTSIPPEEISGATEYFSVQIGVYRRTVTVNQLMNVEPIYYSRMRNGNLRYISGVYGTRIEANLARDLIRNKGISDAFVIRYDD